MKDMWRGMWGPRTGHCLCKQIVSAYTNPRMISLLRSYQEKVQMLPKEKQHSVQVGNLKITIYSNFLISPHLVLCLQSQRGCPRHRHHSSAWLAPS